MKKLMLIAFVGILLSSCNSIVDRGNKYLVIQSIETYNNRFKDSTNFGDYKVLFKNSNIELYTDSLYRIGDTLWILKKNSNLKLK